ncbi:MAG: hypothetical protein GX558_01490 [Clostridiales bacterium]|nr:hypothetical protein [Clostridiales bacterium]
MHAMGLDIGTTTLSAVMVDAGTGAVLEALTLPNATEVRAEAWARLQDPDRIWRQVEAIADRLMAAHPSVRCIGLTGQMHGMLYADAKGRAVSPLYTWQDGRGDLPAVGGKTYAQALSRMTGRRLATGYGAVTHFYNRENGLVPGDAASAMTIQDYIGMKLTGRAAPLMHASDAHSFGAADWPGWSGLIRWTERTECLGEARGGIPVAVAIGDNQASFLGSTQSARGSVLVNIGTGGQISVAVDGGAPCGEIDTRPYVDGGSLLVGISLCGGRAYALLERLFRDVAALAGAKADGLYEQMNALAELPLEDPLAVSTLFCGTRRNPALRGEIRGISDRNLTPAHLVQGVLRGMVDELHASYLCMRASIPDAPSLLVGSGNGIRQNPALRRLFESAFGMPLRIPAHREEAAYGAALFAMAASGLRASIADAQRIIRYQPVGP